MLVAGISFIVELMSNCSEQTGRCVGLQGCRPRWLWTLLADWLQALVTLGPINWELGTCNCWTDTGHQGSSGVTCLTVCMMHLVITEGLTMSVYCHQQSRSFCV